MKIVITAGQLISGLFGVLAITAGLINTFWGNDMAFGIFIILLSLVFFLPLRNLFQKVTGIVLHPALLPVARIVAGLFIIWSTLGVGELFDKVDMMMADFNSLNF